MRQRLWPSPEPTLQDLHMKFRLAAVRERLGWSQEALAEAVGMSRTTIYRLEHGLVSCDEPKARIFAKALGVNEWELYGYTHPPDAEEPEAVRNLIQLALRLDEPAAKVLLVTAKELEQMGRVRGGGLESRG